MAIECAPPTLILRSVNVFPYMCDHWCAKGDVWNKVTIHLLLNQPALEENSDYWLHTMSTCIQSASCSIVVLHALPSAPKSADRIEGAIMAGGGMFVNGAEGLAELWETANNW